MIKQKCDGCETIVNNPTPFNDCYLELQAIETPYGGTTCDINITPPINKTKYFCGLGCLKKWLEGKE